MGGAGFEGGVLFEKVADFEVEVWEVSGAAEPVVVGIDVGGAGAGGVLRRGIG